MIPRFYDVTKGAILVDGHDVRDVTQTSLHNNIGVVSQDVFLFADSIAENIRYGKLDATMEDIIEAQNSQKSMMISWKCLMDLKLM